ncbi:Putative 2-aminoethylphosphonate transport system permease protein PhnV [Aquimixticola soesokkakensis]|uniref:Putative 2-aminoethylphosphonate transport system permease protein PhnV n=1 Tax=Aquimixticola soesokkakensis TaxID=1519096 RepID=A0A1Y5SI40_9RHOB|nr:iron ABC transporter permease [Aquimixticola soesokkakensis]SLN41366.1 Putative 2-aminoethylphosphonate transport system permease protein PhnV [Aquimixticola soesokkakensis]
MSLHAPHAPNSRSLDRLLPLLLLPVALIALGPVARLLLEGIGFGDGFTTRHLTTVLTRPSTGSALTHSLVTAGGGTVLSILIGGAFAYLVALTDLRGKGGLVFCLMVPMMIPPQITALAWMQMAGPSSTLLKILGLAPPLGSPQPLHSPGGIILLLGIQHASLVFLTLRAGLRMIPADLVEAARMSGAGPLRVWTQTVLPLSLPALIAGGAMAFVTALGNFGIPAMLGIPAGYATLPTLIYQRLVGMGPSVLPEVAVLALLIGGVAILGVLVSRSVLTRRRFGLVGLSGTPLALSLGAARRPVEITLWAFIFVILALPLLALLATSLIPAYGVTLTFGNATFDAWREVLVTQPVTRRAYGNSLMLATSAAAVLLALCLPLAWLMERRASRFSRLLDALIDLPYALPGVVLSIACILTFLNLPFTDLTLYGTIWIILMAYLARFFVVMLRPIQASIAQLDPAMEEAAASVGARVGRRLRDIVLPLAAPSAAAGAILVFLTAVNELTVSALLWSSGTETLGVVIYNLEDSGDTVMASALAMSIVLLIVVLMGLVQAGAHRFPKGVIPWQS